MSSTAALPTADELCERATVVALPMRVRFRGVTSREVLLIDGPAGWAEFAPFDGYDDTESAWWLRSAVEMAWQGPPAPLRSQVTVNATVPAVTAAQVPEVLDRFPGCRTVKVKVAEPGQRLADDVARVAAVLQHWPDARIRVDANGGWTITEAVDAISVLDQAVRAATTGSRGAIGPRPIDGPGLEYAEQPCATVDELVAVRAALAERGIAVEVAADESIRRADDPFHVVRAGGADRAVVKVAPLGGPRRLLAIAEKLSVPVTISSALDSAVGMAAGLATAAALPPGDDGREPAAAGLGTGGFFLEDVVDPEQGPQLVAGSIKVASVVPEPARLAALTVDTVRFNQWIDRLRRCHEVLERQHATAG